MSGERRSPRLARALLGVLVPARYRDNQLGDLEEEYRAKGARDGWQSADRWYWRQALTSLPGAGRLRYRGENGVEQGRGGAWMERWMQDLRYAARSLWKSPQHAIIATITLSLAIGVNTAIFSMVSQIIFLELPMEEPDDVYWVWSRNDEAQTDIVPMSMNDFLEFRERSRSFESLAAMSQVSMILTGLDRPERLTVATVTANLIDVWGEPPALGRAFTEGEDQVGSPRVALISSSMWQERFGADPDVLGRTLRLDDNEHTIVGVASPRMEAGRLGRAHVWVPKQIDRARADRTGRIAMVTGRLRPGVTFEEAVLEGAAIGEQLVEAFPEVNRGWRVEVRTTKDSIIGDFAATIMILLVLTVLLVLLIACANVANLVLVRASTRMRELAVRAAMGANRGRLVRQLLTENVMIALAAGALGITLASALLRGMVYMTRGQEELFTIAEIDQRVLLFTLGVSLLAPIFFGLLPALGAVRSDLNDSLRDGERAGGSRKGRRTRNGLVVSQIALALSLMIVSGLFVRSVIELQRVDLGFDGEGVLTMVIALPTTRYSPEGTTAFFEELHASVGTMPGVESVAFAGNRPARVVTGGVPFAMEGQEGLPVQDWPTAFTEAVSPDYFATLRIPLIQGRVFEPGDREDAASVALVSREAVARYWPEGDVIGRRIRVAGDRAEWRQIIGVVDNVAGGSDINNPEVPQVYLPHAQNPRRSMVMLARVQGVEAQHTTAIRDAVWAIDSEQPIDDVRTMSDYVYDQNSVGLTMITMFVTFTLFALVMAGMGIYGVMSFMVTQRTREIGLRMALGAERTSVLALVLRQGGLLLGIGSVIGVGLGMLLSRLSAGLIYGVEVNDPVTLVGVPALLAAIALFANVLPARRATNIDPMNTLRSD